MPLPKMPTRADKRPGDTDQHTREYDEKTGGWTKPVQPAPEKTKP